MRADLRALINEGHGLYIGNAERLASAFPWAPRRITQEAVFEWVLGVTHEESPRMRCVERGTYAWAYGRQQRIAYAPGWLSTRGEHFRGDVLDMVLHELGHLFTWHFLGGILDHGREWQQIGLLLGYVPVGNMSIERRRAYALALTPHQMRAQLAAACGGKE